MEDNNFNEYLEATISKNSKINKILLGITLFCLIVGMYALLSRQNDLLTASKDLADKNDSLKKKTTELYAINQKLTDDLAMTDSRRKLTQEEQQLTADRTESSSKNDQTTAYRHEKAHTPPQSDDVASSLNASNISIIPTPDKKAGTAQGTTTAHKANEIVVGFDVANLTAGSGQTDLYVCLFGPDGKPISTPAMGSGSFKTRDEGPMLYTAKIPVDFESKSTQSIKFALKQNTEFAKGDYKVEIYHQGYKIGEGTKELKKNGIFGRN